MTTRTTTVAAAIPSSLLAELQSVSERVQQVVAQQAHMLEVQRSVLDNERREQEAVLAERQWKLRSDEHDLVKQQTQWRHAQDQATAAGAYQDRQVCLKVGTSSLVAAVPSLVDRAPKSGLAQLVQFRLAESSGGAADEPVPIFLDRDSSTMHYVVRWLRDGPEALGSMPPQMLRSLRAEGRHWELPELVAQCDARLGAPDAAADGAATLGWLLEQIGPDVPEAPVLHALLSELSRFLAAGQARRALASRAGALERLLKAMEAHPSDAGVLRAGFGCASLLGADKAAGARPQLKALAPRLRALLDAVPVVQEALAAAAALVEESKVAPVVEAEEQVEVAPAPVPAPVPEPAEAGAGAGAEAASGDGKAEGESAAATRIQARVRGKEARRHGAPAKATGAADADADADGETEAEPTPAVLSAEEVAALEEQLNAADDPGAAAVPAGCVVTVDGPRRRLVRAVPPALGLDEGHEAALQLLEEVCAAAVGTHVLLEVEAEHTSLRLERVHTDGGGGDADGGVGGGGGGGGGGEAREPAVDATASSVAGSGAAAATAKRNERLGAAPRAPAASLLTPEPLLSERLAGEVARLERVLKLCK